MQSNFEKFLNAYLTCLVWSSSATDENGEEFESLESFELSDDLKIAARSDSVRFIDHAAILFLGLPDGYDYANAGHDFWLTRNGHGAGFWDRGLGELGDRLTELSQSFGEKSPYIGDDGLLYLH
ncbi:hypothetical protein Hena1_02600 [Erwinia phage Hena1]|uniref:Uncharacterized protein n=1 Tax=Erwinia phage Hena1 TaxID=2678601 RepID=A0A6B9J5T9_9CAUD|nr:hypothetical protein HWC84_gp104 [Erwinia phage Hena1]QGZ16410.1 hypothetical protein Hena1_02600 [Erwinia phage Hena1]